MTTRTHHGFGLGLGLAAVVGLLTLSIPAAHAEEPPERSDAELDTAYRPNRPLLIAGSVIFGASYGPSLLYDQTSTYNTQSDLGIPVAGPWLDLRNDVCTMQPCDELSSGLLILDGLAQAIGVGLLLSSLFVPEDAFRFSSRSASVVLTPSRLSHAAYGLGASGSF
jgi:hypothetical protein